MDISRPCQPEKLIPLLPWPGFDPSFSGHNDRRGIISEWARLRVRPLSHRGWQCFFVIEAGVLVLEAGTWVFWGGVLVLEAVWIKYLWIGALKLLWTGEILNSRFTNYAQCAGVWTCGLLGWVFLVVEACVAGGWAWWCGWLGLVVRVVGLVVQVVGAGVGGWLGLVLRVIGPSGAGVWGLVLRVVVAGGAGDWGWCCGWLGLVLRVIGAGVAGDWGWWCVWLGLVLRMVGAGGAGGWDWCCVWLGLVVRVKEINVGNLKLADYILTHSTVMDFHMVAIFFGITKISNAM